MCGPRHRSFQTFLAGGRVEVVVDGQLAAADLDGLLDTDLGGCGRGARIGCGCAALEPDQLELVRLTGQFLAGLLVADLAAGKALALLHDLAHPLLDGLEVVGAERLGHVEVVVEAVFHRRPDAQLGLGEQLLDGLGHHVRGGVPHDGPAVVAADLDRLDGVTVGQRGGQVAQLAVDPRRDDRGPGPGRGRRLAEPERVTRRSARVHHVLATGEGDVKLLGRHGGLPG